MKKILHTLVLLFSAQLLFSQSFQAFTSNGSFTVPAAITSITIEVVGAGGNGAGNGGGGGGGGGYAKGIFAVTPGTVLAINIGNGGGGSGGGSTSVVGLISATGGGNGTTVGNPNVGGGGAGGTGINGNIVNRTGGTGGGGFWTYFGGGGAGAGGSVSNGSNGGNTIVYNGTNCLTPGGSGGAGGGAPGGNGGKGAGFIDSQCNNANPAAPGSNYGGGGGGGNGNSSPAQNGVGGYCNIEYGCIAPNAPVISGGSTTLCSGSSATIMATGSGTINWYTNSTGGSAIGTGSTFVTSALTTTTITYYASSETCTSSVQRTAFTVSVFPLPVVTISISPAPYCVSQPFTLSAGGAQNYIWNNSSTGSTQTITPQGTVVFPPVVTGTGTNGCTNSASISINVYPQPTLTIIPQTTLCAGKMIAYAVSGASSYLWSNGFPSANFSVTLNSSTVFTVTGTSNAGCTNTAAITQTVVPNPTVTITGKTQICLGESLSLTASGADTYTWAGNGTSTVITMSPTGNTVYTLTGFNTQGCSSTITRSLIVNICQGIKESTNNNHFVIYPNPSNGVFTIKADMDVTLYVYSFSGQVLQTVNLDTKNDRTCSLDGFAKGIYFIADDKGNHAQKIIVH